MRRRAAPLLAAVFLASGCPGDPGGDAGAQADASTAQCSPACPDGSSCVNGACVETVCGDGIVSPGEECDDGNETAFDGCEPGTCTFTCTEDARCSDGDSCNGVEVCDLERHVCVAGTAADDGAACEIGICRSGACVGVGCGNGVLESGEECDDGNEAGGDGCENDCTFSCTSDADCDDENACNGVESCDLSAHTCVPGIAPDCDDGSQCTIDTCDPALGCVNTLIDEDGDGHAPDIYECGDDCNDLRADVHPGHVELCDTVDHDCDGELVPRDAPIWYLDCDGDGFSTAGAANERGCDEPPPASCGGGWTTRVPIGDDVDCDDTRADRSPGLSEIAGDEANLDEDCDGRIVCYADADGDGYRTGVLVVSADADCSDPGEAYASDPAGDCCDSDERAHPGAGFQTSARGCGGGYDFDCNGASERQWTDTVSGCRPSGGTLPQCSSLTRAGWLAAAPAECGALGNWASTCERPCELGPRGKPECRCDFGTDARRQACR